MSCILELDIMARMPMQSVYSTLVLLYWLLFSKLNNILCKTLKLNIRNRYYMLNVQEKGFREVVHGCPLK